MIDLEVWKFHRNQVVAKLPDAYYNPISRSIISWIGGEATRKPALPVTIGLKNVPESEAWTSSYRELHPTPKAQKESWTLTDWRNFFLLLTVVVCLDLVWHFAHNNLDLFQLITTSLASILAIIFALLADRKNK